MNFFNFFFCCGSFLIHWPDLIPIQYGYETLILTTWFSYPIDECKNKVQDTVIKNDFRAISCAIAFKGSIKRLQEQKIIETQLIMSINKQMI